MPNLKRVLCIGAHPDDIEFGCGATLNKHLQRWQDWDVRCLTLSRSANAELEKAHRLALTELGVPPEQIELHDLVTSHMNADRQAAWEILDRAWRTWRPDMVFTHESDYHQDHDLVYHESMRTFYDCSVFLYGISRSQSPSFEGAYFEKVTEADIAVKLAALEHYASLPISDGIGVTSYRQKPYFRREAIIGKMAYDGIATLSDYAEVFRVVRLIGALIRGC
jgi:LmbE family N-acetylglucosaminyl deacetylase